MPGAAELFGQQAAFVPRAENVILAGSAEMPFRLLSAYAVAVMGLP